MLALAMGVVGALVAWRISAGLQKALGAEPGVLSASAREFSNGNLGAVLTWRSGDEGSTMAALHRTQEALRTIVTAVRDNAESVATASSQIAQGNADLSHRTEQQASALQQTAATMDELGATVRHNADNAQEANRLAMDASGVASRGGQVMAEVIQTIQGIQESSNRIADIVGVIDGIAFQTNILALNAAVEAARAGEQGRGFAVVAGEVRALAQRSAEAAREIKVLIGGSVEQVDQGVGLVQRAGSTMEDVVSAIARVTQIVGEISHASREQSTGVSQIGQAITQLDQVTQQNAALVEEGAAAAESLQQQAEQLVKAMAFFKVSRR
jgi:methyl-accepting chemotaxis protein